MAASSTAASTSTSLNPSNTSNSAFDVFINHRGPDVKNTFASNLYYRLTSSGLKVFLDREELQQGEHLNCQIEGAIRTASVHVAIFSTGYANSTWCLNELLMMLESRGKIIPVFYQVKPTDLRWTQGKDGVYAQSLQKLGEKPEYEAQTEAEAEAQSRPKTLKLRHNKDTIEQWRNALSKLPLCLEELEVDGCVQLKNIWGLDQLTTLHRLNVSGCAQLDELPNMELLTSLEGLRAKGCRKLKRIRGLLQCTQLRTLNLYGCRELEEVECVEYCTWLEELDVRGCPKLQLLFDQI